MRYMWQAQRKRQRNEMRNYSRQFFKSFPDIDMART